MAPPQTLPWQPQSHDMQSVNKRTVHRKLTSQWNALYVQGSKMAQAWNQQFTKNSQKNKVTTIFVANLQQINPFFLLEFQHGYHLGHNVKLPLIGWTACHMRMLQ